MTNTGEQQSKSAYSLLNNNYTLKMASMTIFFFDRTSFNLNQFKSSATSALNVVVITEHFTTQAKYISDTVLRIYAE